MLATMQKNRMQIKDFQSDLEVINPIESKTILGGDWYDGDYGYPDSIVYYDNGGYDYGGWWDNFLGDGWDQNGGPGDGNGSGTPPNNGPTYPTHICQQLPQGSTCATMALSYVANYFGATGLSSSDFAEMTGNNYMSMMMGTQQGLTISQLSTVISNIFHSSQISTYEQIAANANNGNPVLATITQGGGLHEIVITNLNLSNGNITYMDSLQGGVVNENIVSPINPNNSFSFVLGTFYAVTGVQNNATVNQYKNDTNDITCSICGH